jgi:hypothetical protein
LDKKELWDTEKREGYEAMASRDVANPIQVTNANWKVKSQTCRDTIGGE